MPHQLVYPDFANLKVSDYIPKFKQYSQAYKEALEQQLASKNYNYLEFNAPLDLISQKLNLEVYPLTHLNAVLDSEEIRQAYKELIPLSTEFSLYISQHKELYQATKEILAQGLANNSLNKEQIKSLTNSIEDFELSGIALEGAAKEEYTKLVQELAQVANDFANNVIDSVNNYQLIVTDFAKIKDLPESALSLAKQSAAAKNLEGWRFTLDFPSYGPLITYSSDRELRKEIFHAFATRSSDLASPEAQKFDNHPNTEKMLELKYKIAKILGFSNIADHSLRKKMVKESTVVKKFLADLTNKTLPKANLEATKLHQLAAQDGIELQAWDVAYYSNKLQLIEADFDPETLRPYFPEARVMQGMFAIIDELFDIKFVVQDVDNLHHKDAKLYYLYKQDQLIGAMIFDLYMRPGKQGGAWVNNCMDRHITPNLEQLPVTYVTCNFNPPLDGVPALFSHSEVLTLFHEMGHALHNTITTVNDSGVSGFNSVEWDAVELPSQFMENFIWEPKGLELISEHYQTKETLPQELIDKLIQNKNFNSGLFLIRQIENGVFDMQLHDGYSDQQKLNPITVHEEARKELTLKVFKFTEPVASRLANSFLHIFGGGYTAGYYSYLWAEVLSADAFESFVEAGVFNKEVGAKFRDKILQVGGVNPAMENFIAFKGREPQIEPLLKSYGII